MAGDREDPSDEPDALTPPPPAVTPRMAAFLERTIVALRAAHPDCSFEADLERYRVRIRDERAADAAFEGHVNLENIYKVERDAAIARSRGVETGADPIADIVRMIGFLRAGEAVTAKDFLERSKPVVVPRSDYRDLDLARSPLRSGTFDVGYAIDFGLGISWVTLEHLEQAGIALEELRVAATENLERASDVSIGVLGTLEDERGPLGAVLEAPDGLASSRIFLPEVREQLEALFPAGYRVAIPGRDVLVALAAARLDECGPLVRRLRADFAGAAHPLSPELHAPGEFERLI